MTAVTRSAKRYDKVLHDNEAHFADVAMSSFSLAYPDFMWLPADFLVEAEDGSKARPDAIWLSCSYHSWYVVEVELSSHSLSRHVRPQLETLKSGDYRTEHAEWVHNRHPQIDTGKLAHLMAYTSPDVVVVVNDTDTKKNGWGVLEQDRVARITFAEVYRCPIDNDSVVAWSGFAPRRHVVAQADAMSLGMINAILLTDAKSLQLGDCDMLSVMVGTQVISFRVHRTPSGLILQPNSAILDLRRSARYKLARLNNGTLDLRPQ